MKLAEIARGATNKRELIPTPKAAIEELIEAFGRGLANVIDILDPSAVVLGGGVSNLDFLYGEGVERVAKYVFNDELETPILRHQLGDSAGRASERRSSMTADPQSQQYREYNFDGLVGPTHNYGGLSVGNIASMAHEGSVANPRLAALEGWRRMRFVHANPGWGKGCCLRTNGQASSRCAARVCGQRRRSARCGSQPFRGRWCARSRAPRRCGRRTPRPWRRPATRRIARLHVTPANLRELFHRSIEAETTERVLATIFADTTGSWFTRRSRGVGSSPTRGGEPHAARLARLGRGAPLRVGALELRRGRDEQRFPARQTREASESIARPHRSPDR